MAESTRAGKLLYWVVAAVAVAGLLWLVVSIPGWLDARDLGRLRGPLILVGFVLAAIASFLGAALLYAALAVGLEGLGVKLELGPGELSAEQDARAAATLVHVVWYVYREEDDFDHTVTRGVPLALHAAAADADADRAARGGPPAAEINPTGLYVLDGPCNLLAMAQTGIVPLAVLREYLARGGPQALAPRVWYSPSYYAQYLKAVPLTREESRRANALLVWTVYYEDRFHIGPSRETYPVAVCLSANEAETEVARRGPVESGGDGYLAQGPSPLVPEGRRSTAIGADVVREVLRRAQRGEPGPVPVV